MSIWPFKRNSKLNTIYLGDDLDDVEFLMDVEESCGIEIGDPNSQKLVTMGDLEAVVRKRLVNAQDFDPVWALLCRIARDHTRHKGPIDRETTFFAKFAKERTSNG